VSASSSCCDTSTHRVCYDANVGVRDTPPETLRMEMTNSRVIPASPAAVWTALNDPSILQASIPGCESLERIGDNEWRAVVAAKVGPVSAKFSGTMRMIDPTPPTGYTLQFTGQGGAAGFASGEARVTLTPAENGH